MAQDTGSPKRVSVAARRTKALKLRQLGTSYAEIARIMKDEYRNARAVRMDIRKRVRESVREQADELLELELMRLDSILVPVMKKAIAGDLWAVDRALTIMERRSKYLGLDHAQRPDDYSEVDAWLAGTVDDTPDPDIDPDDVLGPPEGDSEYEELDGDELDD